MRFKPGINRQIAQLNGHRTFEALNEVPAEHANRAMRRAAEAQKKKKVAGKATFSGDSKVKHLHIMTGHKNGSICNHTAAANSEAAIALTKGLRTSDNRR